MQSEEFDNKIRGAAENHHPSYDEKAWDKMEVLLDKHLPEEERKRRGFIFFLLLFLLLGTGAVLITTKPWEGGNRQSATDNRQPAGENKQLATGNGQPSVDNKEPTILKNETADKITEDRIKNEGVTGASILSNGDNSTLSPFINKKKNSNPVVELITGKSKKRNSAIADNIVTMQGSTIINKLPVDNSNEEQKTVATSPNDIPSKTIIATDEKTTPAERVIDTKHQEDKTEDTKTDKDVSVNTKEESKKVKNKKTNSFFFTLSAGPDISFAGSGKAGNAQLFTGLGIGYTFNNKLTVRTGFYNGRKVYPAMPEAYHPPAAFYNFIPYLQKVEADCKVYEIPVSLSYHFGKSNRQNWFVSTGLSTYLMKKETYQYDYKYTPTGATLKRSYTIKNENNHFFSVVTFSAGYQRQLNKTISVSAEPYLKLPLSGVGYGNVKLNSAGILFSVSIKPFAAPKK